MGKPLTLAPLQGEGTRGRGQVGTFSRGLPSSWCLPFAEWRRTDTVKAPWEAGHWTAAGHPSHCQLYHRNKSLIVGRCVCVPTNTPSRVHSSAGTEDVFSSHTGILLSSNIPGRGSLSSIVSEGLRAEEGGAVVWLSAANEMSHLGPSALFTIKNKVVSKSCNTQLKIQPCN